MTELPHRLPILQSPQWGSIPGLLHGFCGRAGGSSHGVFAQLNLSYRVGDAHAAVRENWERLGRAVAAPVRFITVRQVHGADVVAVTRETADAGAADALLTGAPAVALSILTADCVPILLVAPRQRMVAALHAGWRGTLAGIAEIALQELRRGWGVRPEDVRAALGPSIGACCYEVDRDIVDRLQARWGAMPDAVRGAGGTRKAMLDLRHANAAVLARMGVAAADITCVGPCTRCAADTFFSYRAAPRGVTGRQVSFIGWRE